MIEVMWDLQRLRVFRAVVAAGSINAAATNLGFTASAVSQQVATLARETGLVLLQKAGRGVEPTAAGLELAAASDALFEDLDQLRLSIADLRDGRAGTLSMAYFDSAALQWIPGIVRTVVADYPELRLDLRVQQESTELEASRADVEVLVAPTDFVAPPGFRAQHLLNEAYEVVVHERHPFATRPFVEMAELADERWISSESEQSWCRINTHRCATAAGFEPQYSVHTGGHQTATAFVAAGIGIAVMPHLCTLGAPANVRVIPIVNPTPVRSIHAMVRRSVEATPAVSLVLQGLMAAASGSAPSGR
ncbi:MAG: LysR family transcriptional regulator [Propionibacteriaceae bacterium]|nr:LysR family transcriptional regulator [Micropruina sp.]HBX82871.1 LysR family transcriptional regulator [Propionibacteriaceae bacterium]HBY23380.1 LysR family transcriptional regulator [Propionibacteriaceae bacterium]